MAVVRWKAAPGLGDYGDSQDEYRREIAQTKYPSTWTLTGGTDHPRGIG